MAESTQASSALAVWQTEMLRLTAFSIPPIVLSKDSSWWTDLVGEEPETREAKPRIGALIESGKYRDAQLGLAIQPNRVDWTYSILEDGFSLEANIRPSLGSFPETLETFREIMHKWLDLPSIQSINRLAFGAVVFRPVESLEAGYRLLSENYLPFKINAQRSSDFVYQINKRTDSRISRLELNRLRKWSVASRQNFMFAIIQGQSPSTSLQSPQVYSVRLELDINTAADYEGIFDHDLLSQIFDELVLLGEEIAENGDKT